MVCCATLYMSAAAGFLFLISPSHLFNKSLKPVASIPAAKASPPRLPSIVLNGLSAIATTPPAGVDAPLYASIAFVPPPSIPTFVPAESKAAITAVSVSSLPSAACSR